MPRTRIPPTYRYVYVNGEPWELVSGEDPEVEELWADSQVSSGWMSFAYRSLGDMMAAQEASQRADEYLKEVHRLAIANTDEKDVNEPLSTPGATSESAEQEHRQAGEAHERTRSRSRSTTDRKASAQCVQRLQRLQSSSELDSGSI